MKKINKRLFNFDPPEITPLEVRVNGSFEDACRKFKALFQKERIASDLKERESYEKPSEKKRRKKREAKERNLMLLARERMMATGEWDKKQKRKAAKQQRKLEDRIREQEKSED